MLRPPPSTLSTSHSQIMILAHTDPANEEPFLIFTQHSSLPGIFAFPGFKTQHTIAPQNRVVLCPRTKQCTTYEQHSGAEGGKGGWVRWM